MAGTGTLATWRNALAVCLPFVVFGLAAPAQMLPTASLSGRVLHEGKGLPGATVAASASTLQGTRTAVSGLSGDYVFNNIPPGEYVLSYTMPGFHAVSRAVKLSASQQSRLDVVMSLAVVGAEVTVTAESQTVSETTAEATTYTARLLAALPTTRTVNAAIELAPGVSTNGGSAGFAVVPAIAGAPSNENLWTVNGVVVNNNSGGNPLSLYIEDAVLETTTSTASVSAEFGRFMGGIVNVITKSGGNRFSGTVRSTLTNDSWQATSAYRVPGTGANPQEGTFVNKVVPTWEATFGGPILRDRIWFFGAVRSYDLSRAQTLVTRYTNIPYTSGTKELRTEAKLTVSPLRNHTLTGSFIALDTENAGYSFGPVADLASTYDRRLPQQLLALNYNGVVTPSLFVEGQYSRRRLAFEDAGGRYTDFGRGTVIRDVQNGAFYNAPVFCGVCGDERHDNDNFVVKGTYFVSSPVLGAHNLVAGYDDFGGQLLSNNHQSASNFVLYTRGSVFRGADVYPVLEHGAAELDYWPILKPSQGSDVRTTSVYVNDSWRPGSRLSLNVGLRYDRNHATDSLGNVTSRDSKVSPRLAATFDLEGDGGLRAAASYARYVAALQEGIAGSGGSLGGTPADFFWYYDGPPINTDPTKPLLSPSDALAKVLAWFTAGGCYPDPLSAGCSIPQGGQPWINGVNVRLLGSLASPSADEYAVGLSGNLGKLGVFRADLVRRVYRDFYDYRTDTSTGRVTSPIDPSQVYDLTLIENSNAFQREYTGLHAQASVRPADGLDLGASWTWSHLIGDLPGTASYAGGHMYPEYVDKAWNNPVGSLGADTRHRVRLFGTYDVPLPARLGAVSVGAVWAWDTGAPYGAAGMVRSAPYVANPGYLTPPAAVTYWFTARDAFRTEDVFRTDLSLNYSRRIGRDVEVFVSPSIYNLFNAQHVTSVNTSVETGVTNPAAYKGFDPFATAPVRGARGTGANWNFGPRFGQPVSGGSWSGQGTYNLSGYQPQRRFQVSAGIRF